MTRKAKTNVSWAYMTAMRNRIVHGYFGIDDAILFTAAQTELNLLLPRLEALARRHGVKL
jgi:uncharacterized protein with HEPN domain